MSDSIDRKAAIANAISGLVRIEDGEKWIRVSEVRESLLNMPSAEPERKKGKWIIDRHGNWACDQCGNDPYHCNMENMNFCPNCGADMREEKEAER